MEKKEKFWSESVEVMKTLHRCERADWEKVGEGAPHKRDSAQLLVTFKMMSIKVERKILVYQEGTWSWTRLEGSLVEWRGETIFWR